MSAHTPGPWLKEGHTVYALTENARGQACNRFSLFVQSARQEHEAQGSELDANARLAAAAPELLEAVERLCGSLGVMVTDPDNDADILFGRAAIAKAVQP